MLRLPSTLFGTVVAMALATGMPAHSADIGFSAGTEYFSWREYNISGSKLLEETGPRYFLAVDVVAPEGARLAYDFSARVYGGNVAYDGQTWGGDPAETDVGYLGLSGEAGLATLNHAGDGAYIGLRLALGSDSWVRDIKGAGGYEEVYQILFTRLGFPFRASSGWGGELGLKYPLWSREEAGLAGTAVSALINGVPVNGSIQENPQFEPKGSMSFYAEFDLLQAKKWDLRFRYDSFRFDASELVGVPVLFENGMSAELELFQPDSHLDTYGLQFRYWL